jgi:CHASE2 domain-containing sensor protein
VLSRRRLRARSKAAALILAAVLAGGVALALDAAHILRRGEQATIDARYQLRKGHPDPRIVVVGIDDATFDELRRRGEAQWPFPRRYHARVIDALRRAGARTIAFDIQFTEPTNTVDDGALVGAIGRAGNVVLATTEVGLRGTTNVLGGDTAVREAHARVGASNYRADSDGTIRVMDGQFHGLKTFPVQVANRPAPASAPIDFAGPPGTYPAISYSRVLYGTFPPGAVRGKIVIVGAASTSLRDVYETPMSGGAPMSAPELQANATATVLRGSPLRAQPGWSLPIMAVVLALAVLAGIRFGTVGMVIGGFALAAVWALGAQLAFDAGAVLDFTTPASALFLFTAAGAVIGISADDRDRRRLRQRFAAADAAVVDDILAGRTLKPTDVIAGYKLERVIGRGGMGVVYRARQFTLDRTVAIKLIADERAHDPVFRERFKRECRLASAISHANVVPVHEAGEDDGLLFIAMPLIDGVDLGRILARGGALEPARAVGIVTQLAAALDAAHERGIVHRDVKPANTLVTRGEHVYLTDFGVAKEIGDKRGMTRAGWVGTFDYVAPEQADGGPPGPAADIYALAGVLAHCLTGSVPFPRDSDAATLLAHLSAPPPVPSMLREDLPQRLDAVVARGMAKDPAQRYPSATALAQAAAHALGLGPPPGPAPAAPRPHTSPTIAD